MRRSRIALLLAVALLPLAGCRRSHAGSGAGPPSPNGPEVARLRGVMETVRPLYHPLGPAVPGDWRFFSPEEGQTFSQYLASNPNVPDGKRRFLYVRPLGDLTPAQLRIVQLTAEYLERFYELPARIAPALPLGAMPAWAHFRVVTTERIQTGYLMDRLKRVLPDDAFAEIGLTAADLYPNDRLSLVFGQASLRDRVGVWSLHWLGEPDQSEAEFRTTLARTLKIASHETGHMFSIPHCTKYLCVMNGTGSLNEVDRHPLDACPECMAKICWATGYDPRRRFERIAEF
ncbi:MAG TPA: archaemetzincin, partial [Thermoanaerobaculia bacterium]